MIKTKTKVNFGTIDLHENIKRADENINDLKFQTCGH